MDETLRLRNNSYHLVIRSSLLAIQSTLSLQETMLQSQYTTFTDIKSTIVAQNTTLQNTTRTLVEYFSKISTFQTPPPPTLGSAAPLQTSPPPENSSTANSMTSASLTAPATTTAAATTFVVASLFGNATSTPQPATVPAGAWQPACHFLAPPTPPPVAAASTQTLPTTAAVGSKPLASCPPKISATQAVSTPKAILLTPPPLVPSTPPASTPPSFVLSWFTTIIKQFFPKIQVVTIIIRSNTHLHLAKLLSNANATFAYSHNLDESKPLIFDPGGKIEFECYLVARFIHDSMQLSLKYCHNPDSTAPIPLPPAYDLEDKVDFKGSVMIRYNIAMHMNLHTSRPKCTIVLPARFRE